MPKSSLASLNMIYMPRPLPDLRRLTVVLGGVSLQVYNDERMAENSMEISALPRAIE